MDSLKLKFTSGNDVPVTEARITIQEFTYIIAEIADLKARNKQYEGEWTQVWKMNNEQASHIELLREALLSYCDMEADVLEIINSTPKQSLEIHNKKFTDEISTLEQIINEQCATLKLFNMGTFKDIAHIQSDAAKKAYWQGFETARCFPDESNILTFWTKWQEQLKGQGNKVNYTREVE